MNDDKVRILAIAPYEAMKTAMERLAQKRDDIELDVFVGDLDVGKELVLHQMQKPYDAIISRGGTASLIETITELPVVEVSLSVYDILRSIKLAENYKEKYAIIGFPSITSSAHMLCDLLQYELDIFTIHAESEAHSLLVKLKQEEYRMVVCDMISYTQARQLGLNAILITSGVESIEDAFSQAVKISTSQIRTRRENLLFRHVLNNAEVQTIVFGPEMEVYFSSNTNSDAPEIADLLRRELPRFRTGENKKIYRSIAGTLYAISGQVFRVSEMDFTSFQITLSKLSSTLGKNFLTYSDQDDAEKEFYNSFYSITGAMGTLEDTVNHFSQNTLPVLISGETGTGKEQIARALYLRSSNRANPFVTIDCSRITDKSWSYLTDNFKSPFNDNDNTIFFQNLNALPEELLDQLLTLILDSGLQYRNRLLFSCVNENNSQVASVCSPLIKTLSCLTICLPPLRERIHELPNLSSIYLSTLNVSLGKQISGFEPKAMEMLLDYDWPENYAQFKRMATELAVLTDTPYITSHSVANILDKERSSIVPTRESARSSFLDQELTRPLDDITRDIIRHAVAANNGNQSLTAKQLQISRTTLWRYMKD